MPRYAVIDDSVVVGVVSSPSPPTIDVPKNRIFVNVQDLPDIKGGEIYDPVTGVFSQPIADTTITSRLAKVESDVLALKVATKTANPLV
jgi:hypothetical protein